MITVSGPVAGQSRPPRQPQRRLSGRTALAAAIPLLCALLLPAGAAFGQRAGAPNEAPARIGNTWNGFDHQPTQSQVHGAERASGVAPSAQEQRREAQIVRELNEQLLNSAGAGRTGAAG
jgi:hypothetical protein